MSYSDRNHSVLQTIGIIIKMETFALLFSILNLSHRWMDTTLNGLYMCLIPHPTLTHTQIHMVLVRLLRHDVNEGNRRLTAGRRALFF